MKVKLGNYKNYFGPYQLAELLCFWVKDVEDEYGLKSKPEWVHDFGEWLAYGSVLPDSEVGEVTELVPRREETCISKLLTWIYSKRNRTIKVRIDKFDTWNTDETLGYIIRPLLKQLKNQKQGAPDVDFEDVPEHLRPSEEEVNKYKEEGVTDEKFFDRWDWVLDEMIFAFESLTGGENENWEAKFIEGEHHLQKKQLENGLSKLVRGPNDTIKVDFEGQKEYGERIQNGFRLFGKYYSALWS